MPPDGWSAYRSLEGSGFHAPEQDPNPFRRVLDAIREIETTLIDTWLLSPEVHAVDMGRLVGDGLARHDLHCSERADLVYLGFLLPCHGWIDVFRPLFQECLGRYLAGGVGSSRHDTRDTPPILPVTLKPLGAEVRALLSQVEPHSAATWHSRLSSRSGLDAREKPVVDQVRRALGANPPQFVVETGASRVGPSLEVQQGGISGRPTNGSAG
jgi:hypothetical protein